MAINREEKGYFYVEWCPVCNQGWLAIRKEIKKHTLFLECEECMSRWSNPKNIGSENSLATFYKIEEYISQGKTPPILSLETKKRGQSRYATLPEIKKAGWEKYVKNKEPILVESNFK